MAIVIEIEAKFCLYSVFQLQAKKRHNIKKFQILEITFQVAKEFAPKIFFFKLLRMLFVIIWTRKLSSHTVKLQCYISVSHLAICHPADPPDGLLPFCFLPHCFFLTNQLSNVEWRLSLLLLHCPNNFHKKQFQPFEFASVGKQLSCLAITIVILGMLCGSEHEGVPSKPGRDALLFATAVLWSYRRDRKPLV